MIRTGFLFWFFFFAQDTVDEREKNSKKVYDSSSVLFFVNRTIKEINYMYAFK